jgi:hypothetical protein
MNGGPIFISHRGNLYGRNVEMENHPDIIRRVIESGFHCEIDIWYLQEFDHYYLGHDYPTHYIDLSFLQELKEYLWIHCKNIEALIRLKDEYNCFFHAKDSYTLTSKGVIWGNIDSKMTKEIVCVMPELGGNISFDVFGICTDFPVHYRDTYTRSVCIKSQLNCV